MKNLYILFFAIAVLSFPSVAWGNVPAPAQDSIRPVISTALYVVDAAASSGVPNVKSVQLPTIEGVYNYTGNVGALSLSFNSNLGTVTVIVEKADGTFVSSHTVNNANNGATASLPLNLVSGEYVIRFICSQGGTNYRANLTVTY